jgi:hypothetical protein
LPSVDKLPLDATGFAPPAATETAEAKDDSKSQKAAKSAKKTEVEDFIPDTFKISQNALVMSFHPKP